jgi:hypothetical protein
MMPDNASAPASRPKRSGVRSLPFEAWSSADRAAWTAACQPNRRLKRGGAGAHLKAITLADLKRRYGYFLDFLDRSSLLDPSAPPAAQVNAENVGMYIAELKGGLRHSLWVDPQASPGQPVAQCSR